MNYLQHLDFDNCEDSRKISNINIILNLVSTSLCLYCIVEVGSKHLHMST